MKIEYIIVKEKNEISSDRSTFLKLLETNSGISINESNISCSDSDAAFQLSCEESDDENEIIFHLIIESESGEKEEDLENLNTVARGIRKTIKGSGYTFFFNTIWDETSQFYCEKSYPLINIVENLMRKLIFQFMLKSMGSKWIKEAFPQQLKQKISQTAKKNNAEGLLKDSLYHADFIQLIELLFERYTKVRSVKNLFERLEKVEEIEEVEEIIDLKPQSNWERYFSDLIEFENLDDTWRTLYEYRNIVAHNKLITKSDYEEIVRLTELVKEKLKEALDNLDEIEIPEEEKEDISNFTSKSIESNRYWSDQKITDFTNDPLSAVNSNALDPPKCKGCGDSIDLTNGMPIDGYCRDCRISTALNTGINIDKKCRICGNVIDNDLSFNTEICTSCLTSTTDLNHTSLFNQDLSSLNTDIGLTGNIPTGLCKKCGKSLPVGSTKVFCDDCK